MPIVLQSCSTHLIPHSVFFGASPSNTIQYIQYIRWKENFQDPYMEPSSEPQVPTENPILSQLLFNHSWFQHSEGRSKKGFIYKFYGQHVSSHQDVSKYLKNYAKGEMSNVQNPFSHLFLMSHEVSYAEIETPERITERLDQFLPPLSANPAIVLIA